MNRCSEKLRRAVHEVRKSNEAGHYLSYAQIRRLMDGLQKEDKERLTDHIINIYWPFDDKTLLSFYENSEEMFHAMKSTSGAEHDIRETHYSGSDTIYRDMLRVVRTQCGIIPARLVTRIPSRQKLEVASVLRQTTLATPVQISKFLHMQIGRAE